MKFSSSLLEKAVLEFSRLPGIGKKTALRLVLHLLKQDTAQVIGFSEALARMKQEIRFCRQCHNVSDAEICQICQDTLRRKSIVCVVETIRDVMAIEATQQYSGLYHVLGGLISPLDGVGPDDLQIASLVHRIEKEGIEEVIMAISPTMEGDTTTYFISKKLDGLPVRITALSRGVAFGGELEYADELTLARSLQNRLPIENLMRK
ncbi:MAG: recombination protein RecR [Chitinophagaceae bacterium]|nr:recombination protein RecR [Chitinophagaceae bacterium]